MLLSPLSLFICVLLTFHILKNCSIWLLYPKGYGKSLKMIMINQNRELNDLNFNNTYTTMGTQKYSCYLLLYMKWLNDTFSTAINLYPNLNDISFLSVLWIRKILNIFVRLLGSLKTQTRLKKNCCIKWQESFLCRMSTKAQEKPRWTAYFQVDK